MKAIVITEPGGPDVLQLLDRPTPTPASGEVLIRVEAAGLNRADLLQREGKYPAPPGAPADIPGMEIAGEVVEVGDGVASSRVGQKVALLVAGGGYAEYCVASAAVALPYPDDMDAVSAAALPEALFTVWTNVFQRGRLHPGESVLIHGGASGIGTVGIQMAHAYGSRVFTTAGTPERCARLRELGADLAIDYHTEDFVTRIQEATDGKGVDVILDMVGGDYVARNHEVAAIEGRIVQIATLNGAKAEINVAKMMAKRLTHTGSTLRGRDVEFRAKAAREILETVWPWVESGKVKPVVDSVFDLADVADAHRKMASDHFGKIVLRVG